MERSRAEELLRELDDGWQLNPDGHLDRAYSFENFDKAMALPTRGRHRRKRGPSSRSPHRMGQAAVAGSLPLISL
jgi:hypothetical protein